MAFRAGREHRPRAGFTRVRDQHGRHLGWYNPETMEFVQADRGQERRAKLTQYLGKAYKSSEEPDQV